MSTLAGVEGFSATDLRTSTFISLASVVSTLVGVEGFSAVEIFSDTLGNSAVTWASNPN